MWRSESPNGVMFLLPHVFRVLNSSRVHTWQASLHSTPPHRWRCNFNKAKAAYFIKALGSSPGPSTRTPGSQDSQGHPSFYLSSLLPLDRGGKPSPLFALLLCVCGVQGFALFPSLNLNHTFNPCISKQIILFCALQLGSGSWKSFTFIVSLQVSQGSSIWRGQSYVFYMFIFVWRLFSRTNDF